MRRRPAEWEYPFTKVKLLGSGGVAVLRPFHVNIDLRARGQCQPMRHFTSKSEATHLGDGHVKVEIKAQNGPGQQDNEH